MADFIFTLKKVLKIPATCYNLIIFYFKLDKTALVSFKLTKLRFQTFSSASCSQRHDQLLLRHNHVTGTSTGGCGS